MRFASTAIVAAAALVGVAGGLGLYTFVYAKGYSYITNDPAACANCHVMNDQYDGWLKSSHRAVAVCNDCHVPHDLVGKYKTKGENGFWHSYYFTTQSFARPSTCPTRRPAAETSSRASSTSTRCLTPRRGRASTTRSPASTATTR